MSESQPIDGIAPPEQQEPSSEQAPVPEKGPNQEVLQGRMKFIIILFFSVPYAMFVCWTLFLMMILPNPTGAYESLIPLGSLSSLIGAICLLGCAAYAAKRVLSNKESVPMTKVISLAKISGVILPGLLLAGAVPLVITAEPGLWIDFTDPDPTETYVAPLTVTLSVENAVEILRRRGLSARTYGWDFDGDGVKNEDTVVPNVKAVYRKAGAYNVVVRIGLSDGSTRRIVRSLVIPKEVFSVVPDRVIVDEPATFSVSHLVNDPAEIAEVHWDLDADGIYDEVLTVPDITHTFVRTGKTLITAKVVKTNQGENEYAKEIEVFEPEPLPFDVKIVTEPSYLVSPPPFQTIFSVETEEPLRSVRWDFGDGDTAEGTRVGHNFDKKGNFLVTAQARSEEGPTAKITKLVRVVDALKIPDLEFSGDPEVDMKKGLITGEVPLKINLTPRSSLPLITYFWEAPEATVVGSTDTTLQATYRKPDTYTIYLVAEDPEHRVLRMPIKVEVEPPSSIIEIAMNPEQGVAPLKVTFDASETRIQNEEITGFEWIFGDDPTAEPQQGGAVVTHTYEEAGRYQVQVQVHTTAGNSYDADKTIVVRAPLLDACFRASRTEGSAPLGVEFIMECTTGVPASIEWDFADGTVTDEENPIHVFEEPGSYPVKLSIRDANGTLSTHSLTITAR